jgi:WD40 repeat protein
VRFAPDGKSIVTAAQPSEASRNLEKWNAVNGKSLGTLPLVAARWNFSPDGKMLVAWNGREVRVLEVASGQLVTTLSGHSSDVRTATFSPDGLHVATASSDQTVRLWDARTGAEELLLRGHSGRVSCLAFHPSGRYLASGGQQPGDVKVWDLTRQPEFLTAGGVTTFPRSQAGKHVLGHALSLGFASDSRHLVVVYRDQAVQVREAQGGPGAVPMRWLGLTHQVLVPAAQVAVSADGRRVAGVSGSSSQLVTVWDAATGQELLTLRGHTLSVNHVAWSRDSCRLVTAGNERDANQCRREIKVWDAATGSVVAEFQPGGYGKSVDPRVFGVAALSADGERIAFDDYAPAEVQDTPTRFPVVRVKVCEVDSGRELHELTGYEVPPTAIAFSPDGRRLAAGGWQSNFLVHDLAEEPAARGPLSLGSLGSLGELAFSPDGRLLAAADREQVQVWNVRWGQEVLTLRGAPPRTTDNAFNPRLAWSPDGCYLATLNYDRSISLWDGATPDAPADRFREADERAFAWHLAHAQATVGEGRVRAAAEFHLGFLKALAPPNEELRLERGVLYARLGRWQEAAADYGEAQAHQPLELPARAFEYALLRLRAGDLAGWRQSCTYLRECLDRAADPTTAERLARACQLAPEALNDPELAVRAARLAGSADWSPLLFGAAHYRAGRYREAVQSCAAVARANPNQELAPLAWLFLAMAHARLGQTDQARQWLTRLEKRRAEQEAGLPRGALAVIPTEVDWKHWLEVEILHNEAIRVLKAAETALLPRRPVDGNVPWTSPPSSVYPAENDSPRLLTPFRFGGEFVPGNGKNRPWPSFPRKGTLDHATHLIKLLLLSKQQDN